MTTGFPPAVCGVVDMRSALVCEVCNANRAVERHHRRPRRAGGSRLDDTNTPPNCLHLCSHCHTLIERNRALAYLMGWLLPEGLSPIAERVMYRGDWVILDNDGRVWAVAA